MGTVFIIDSTILVGHIISFDRMAQEIVDLLDIIIKEILNVFLLFFFVDELQLVILGFLGTSGTDLPLLGQVSATG